MSKDITPKTQVVITNYEGGQNAVISDSGKSVSVCHTDNGLYDVQAANGKYLYTGKDGDAASAATRNYLKGE